MQFEYTEPQTELEAAFGGYFSINMFGPIEQGDDVRFQRFLERSAPPPRTSVYINSTGGHVEAAMGIGRLIRGKWFSTSVGSCVLASEQNDKWVIPRKLNPGKCFSAATLTFLGGRLRYFNANSQFGVHQFSFKNPSPEDVGRSQRLSASIARYIEEMGIPAAFLEQSALIPGHDLDTLSEEKMRELKVITGGETAVTWGVEVQKGVMWVRGERDALFGHGKVMLCYSKTDRFMFVAMVEAMGRQNELLNFGLVEIVVNGEDTRIDITDRCARAPTGIYIMFMAKLSDDEAKFIAYSASFGVQVRASSDAGVFLGIAPVSTENGGSDKLKGLYGLAPDT
ncbi:hypothetical protein HLI18_32695 [Rhizobium laguerreae]|uniref:COG3904 family protein n=1 Tax=Rhizobium laguerreae TaxID=1076926 RepID=UPI001478E8C7|nr:hypothetical protein [Rhizobium laguerreae]NNG74526.1 hypothetical protein [Rhizobium laguerreae]